jgi:tRNA1(Val) A37 N6-methylase TrmN6
MPEGETTHDILFEGQLHLVQPIDGFRTTTDSLLLAAALNVAPGDKVLDAGCGCGGALLPGAFRHDAAHFTGVEIDMRTAELAREGATLNGFEGRVCVETADFMIWARGQENAFDVVLSNPPYLAPGTNRMPSDRRKSGFLETADLEDWLKAMMFATRHKGTMLIIHRAAELARILEAFDRWGGDIVVLPIRPEAGAEASRVLVKARKGLRRGGVRLLEGLCLKGTDGGVSERLRAIERGEALDWV